MTQADSNHAATNSFQNATTAGNGSSQSAAHDDSTSHGSGGSSGPITGTTGTGIAAEETGYGESGSLPDTAAPVSQ